MLTNPLVERRVGVMAPPRERNELNRLLAAAVTSRRFCNLLLNDPGQAIREGFAGERFSLSREEHDLIAASRASTLRELAEMLVEKLCPTALGY